MAASDKPGSTTVMMLIVCRAGCAALSGITLVGSPAESALPQPTVAKHVTSAPPPDNEAWLRFSISTAVAMATTLP
jgi:hypothetical protein